MSKINAHPILDVPKRDKVIFIFNGKQIDGEKGFTIAAALHQAGYPVHSHSLDGRGRSLACGIGKCGACEMLVDGKVRRICVTKVDGVKEVREFAQGKMAEQHAEHRIDIRKVLRTTVVIVGAGPAGLAVREEFEKYGIDNIVIDNLIHGGKSTTVYRSGTPALPLICSLMKALELIIPKVEDNYK